MPKTKKPKGQGDDSLSLEGYKKVATDADKVAGEADRLRAEIAQKMKQFSGVKFSDSDIHNFALQMGKNTKASSEDVIAFVENLVKTKNITKEQKDQFVKEFKAKNKPKK